MAGSDVKGAFTLSSDILGTVSQYMEISIAGIAGINDDQIICDNGVDVLINHY